MKPQLRVAVVATLLVIGWQTATVRANYQGNWTALFCIGERSPMPPSLAAGAWIFADSTGYDGQWYRLVAHDPWGWTELPRYLDSPIRYQRILLPAVAWLLAFGGADRVDAAYIIAVLIFLFAGVWITAEWSAVQGHSPWWALGFALLPGTLITADRLTVDVAEYTFLIAGLYSWRRRRWMICWFAATAAFLTRDLGVLVCVSMTGLCVVERAWKRALLFSCTAIPGAVWYWHVARTIPVAQRSNVVVHTVPQWVWTSKAGGPLYVIFHPANYALNGWIKLATQFLDGVSIAGVIVAVCLAIAFLRRWPPTLEVALCAMYAGVFFVVTKARFWVDPYSFPRTFSPLVALVAWRGLTERKPWFALPLLLMLARVAWQIGPQALGIAKVFFG
jgi:hypothetical protein